MPYANLPESLWEKMDRCVDSVMEKQGYEKPRAIAICHAQLAPKEKKKSVNLTERIDAVRNAFYSAFRRPEPMSEPYPTDVFDDYIIAQDGETYWRVPYTTGKDGIEFAGRDKWEKVEQEYVPAKVLSFDDEMLVNYGGAVKALGDGHITGYLVRFTSEDSPDMEGEYFTKDTDFDLKDGERTSIYYHHGQDPKLGQRKIGEGTLKVDEVGVWVDGQLAMRDRYEQAIYRMAEQGKQSWSSGTAPHLVERERTEKATWIKRWPLRLDATTTPTPAEPSTRVLTLKAYKALRTESLQVTEPQEDVRTPSAVTATKSVSAKSNKGGIKTMADKRIVKPFANGWAIYEPDGETIVSIHPDQEGATKALAEGSKPDWLKAVELMTAMYEKNQTEFLKAYQAASAARQPGLFATGPEAKVDGKYSFRDFIVAERMQDAKALKAMGAEFDQWDTKVLGDQTGAAGGFTVPTQFLADLIRIDPETEIIWPTGDKITMANRSVQVPGLDTTGSTAGQSNTMGGVYVQWNETGHTKPETEPRFTQIELVAHEISGYTEVKEALLQDSAISIAPLLTTLFRQALMYYTDEAFLDGTGVGQPQGIVTALGTLVLPRQSAGHITYVDAKNIYMHFMSQARGGAFWCINQYCMEEIMDWKDTEGHLIWQPNAREGVPTNIFGLPVKWTEKTPTLGAMGDIILMNPQWYYIGQKQGVSIASSEHFLFRQNRIAYRCVMRVDGQEKLPASVFAKDGVNQFAPFVELGAGAS